jgi:anti-anti-sigma factor
VLPFWHYKRRPKLKKRFAKQKPLFEKQFAIPDKASRATVLTASLHEKISTMLLVTEVFQFEPDITGISCSGRFTLGTRLSETEAMMQSMLEKGVRKLVLDLTHVDFVDSAGLGIIMRISGEMDQCGGHFRIAGPHEQVQRLFDITHTSAILLVDPDLVTSVQKLQQGKAAGTA